MKQKRFLFISTRPIVPNKDGYTVRPYNFLKLLKKQNVYVKLVSFCTKEEYTIIDREALKEVCDEFIPIYINRKLSYLRVIRALFNGNSFKAEFYNTKNAKKVLSSIGDDFDYVCGYLYLTYQFVKNYKSAKWLDLCDSISMLHGRSYENTTNWMKKIFLREEQKRVAKIEKLSVENFKTTIISQKDKEYLEEFCQPEKIEILNNGVNIPEEFSTNYNKNEIAFLGDMAYFQNHIAVKYFIEEILPKLDKNIIFKVIGKEPKNELYKLAKSNKNIIITGFVDDVKKELISSNFMVCPIHVSSGMQNKVLESMALGVPVIATTAVADPITKENFIERADCTEDFVKKISELLNNPEKRQLMSNNSRNYIINNFSWETKFQILGKLLEI